MLQQKNTFKKVKKICPKCESINVMYNYTEGNWYYTLYCSSCGYFDRTKMRKQEKEEDI